AAIDLVDRVIVLDRGGRVALDGPTREVLADHADEVAALGVWLPVATLAAMRLRRVEVDVAPLPLTGGELAAALDGIRSLPPLVPPVRRPRRQTPAITVRNLSVTRGKTKVLEAISLDIPDGDFTAVIGTNGAGKTTLVQAIAGVVPPPRGRIR